MAEYLREPEALRSSQWDPSFAKSLKDAFALSEIDRTIARSARPVACDREGRKEGEPCLSLRMCLSQSAQMG